jgi:hypothetical protein
MFMTMQVGPAWDSIGSYIIYQGNSDFPELYWFRNVTIWIVSVTLVSCDDNGRLIFIAIEYYNLHSFEDASFTQMRKKI